MRKTKIVCTIGPACDNVETLREMCKSGMNVARLNFSHGTHEGHLESIRRLKQVREELGVPLAIMLDTKGPEYRIKTFEKGLVELREGDEFIFTTEDVVGDRTRVSVNYNSLHRELSVGDRILLNNGLLGFRVTSIDGCDIHTVIENSGTLSDRKSMSFPGKVLKQAYLSERDKQDLLFGIEQGVDYIACSFVSCKQDLLDIAVFLKENGAQGIDLIAKIENRSGVENIEEICQACDGIMVARGDMGVEVPYEELPAIQKSLITKSRLLGKRVITATEMLESMIEKPRPTRAEISDVANAVYDGTSAIMLSGETAAGRYPVEAVRAMARIAEHAECDIHYEQRFAYTDFRIRNTVDAISHSVCGMAIDIDAKAIAVCSLSGSTIRMVSRFRPPVDILGMTTNEKTFHKLALSWGVVPVLSETYDSIDVLFYSAKRRAKDIFGLQKGDRLIVTGGMTNGTSGNTNLLKIETI
ncbi:MAG: pyruvate kinase [Clostridia bacterium]|nr:pyruvate kinase [Clostridia bacterium]